MRFRRRKLTKIVVTTPVQNRIVRVIADPVIATPGRVNGKLIPLLILDTSHRPDINELVRVHQSFDEGDVIVQWGAIEGREDNIALFLTFTRPTERIVVIEFDLPRQAALVDQIVTAGAIFIQPGKIGDKLLDDLNVPKVIVEIPDTGFGPYWEKLYLKSITNKLRASGLSRHKAKQAASEAITQMREIGRFQMT